MAPGDTPAPTLYRVYTNKPYNRTETKENIMNSDKRVLIAIVLSIAVWLLYESFLAPPRTAPPQPAPVQTQENISRESAPIPAAPSKPTPTIKSAERIPIQTPTAPEKIITVQNNVYRMALTSSQAAISSSRLLNYKETLPAPAFTAWIRKTFKLSSESDSNKADNYKEMIALSPRDLLPLNTSFVYPNGTVAQVSNWSSTTDTADINAQLGPEQLVFSGIDQNLQFSKRFEFFPEDYTIAFDMVITNAGAETIEGSPFIEWTTQLPEESGGGLFSGNAGAAPRFSYLLKGENEKEDLHDIEEEITYEGKDIAWTAIEEKYFISALIPNERRPAEVRLSASKQMVSYKLVYPYVRLNPGESDVFRVALYIGPRDIDILAQQGAQLERTVNFGYLDIISKPLILMLNFLNGFLHNWGLSIIVLTIIIKILFWPLTSKSFKSMQGMKQLQPQIAELKEKFKDNREEFARKQMELFKRYKVNPLGGCLPMLLQIPVFIALYQGLMNSIELRHATFIPFWINDLSAKDPTYITPIVMGASMFLQQKMTPTTADPAQAKMFMFMPIIFTVMFLNFPSGLVIYWLVNNLISIAQQVYINKKHSDAGGTQCSPSTSKQKQSKKQ